MKNALLYSALASAVSAFGSAEKPSGLKEAVSTKVAYVQGDKILNREKPENGPHEWRDRVKDLQTDIQGRYQKIAADGQQYEKDKADLQDREKSKWMSPSARESKTEELVKRKNDIETAMRYLEEYSMRAQQKLQMDMGDKVKKAAEEVQRKAGWDAVLVVGVIAGSERADVTKDVIAAMDREYDAQKSRTTPAKPVMKK